MMALMELSRMLAHHQQWRRRLWATLGWPGLTLGTAAAGHGNVAEDDGTGLEQQLGVQGQQLATGTVARSSLAQRQRTAGGACGFVVRAGPVARHGVGRGGKFNVQG